jgi:tetratricopeptide (TPR) repeat protein
MGLCLFFQERLEESYGYFAKATWNQAWRCAAHYHLACLDCRKGDFDSAQGHLQESLSHNSQHHKAQVLLATIYRKLQRPEAIMILQGVLKVDPLDHWARHEMRRCGAISTEEFLGVCRNDAQTILDLVFDYAEAGFVDDAAELLECHLANPVTPVAVPNPLSRAVATRYVMAWLRKDQRLLEEARAQSADYFFPSRLHEQVVLEWALQQPGSDALAAYGLGNLYYDQRRHADAIFEWKRSIQDGASFATVFRNIGIGMWNLHRDGEAARQSYLKAISLDPNDSRLISEYDQLCSKLNDPLLARLEFLENHRNLVLLRDDCAVALCSLYNLTNQPAKALHLLSARRFHPWEGGEGGVLRQFTTAHSLLGRMAMNAGDPSTALVHFESAMDTPDSLGEAYHLLQAKADVNYAKASALQALGREDEALACYESSANEAGDFSKMAVTEHSPLSYYRGLSLVALGRHEEAVQLFQELKAFGYAKLSETAKIDYFATSLPNLLVFDEDLQARRDAESWLLIALACHGLGDIDCAASALANVETFTNADQRSADLALAMR